MFLQVSRVPAVRYHNAFHHRSISAFQIELFHNFSCRPPLPLKAEELNTSHSYPACLLPECAVTKSLVDLPQLQTAD